MNRLGFEPSQVVEVLGQINSNEFKIQSVFTHLAASEDPNQEAFTISQSGIFIDLCKELQNGISYPFLKHIANTAAVQLYPQLQMDMVRLGIGLYGINTGSGKLELQEVSTLKTTISQIRNIKKGETVSYGRMGIAEKDAVIATVRIGYADGYPRILSNGIGKMLVNGKLAPIIGTICMDMTMIDISGIDEVEVGDEVEVFGENLSVNKVAAWANTIPYEILTGVSQRVRRIYFQE